MSEVSVTDDDLAVDTVNSVGPGGNFLDSAHTMARYKTVFYESKVSDNDSFEQWTAAGADNAAQSANKRMHKLLDDYEAPELDANIDQALQEYIQKRKAELPDSFA